MTCQLLKDKVGYRGQKYEVHFSEDGVDRIFGWQNESSGGLAEAAVLHPGWTDVRVIPVSDELLTAYLREIGNTSIAFTGTQSGMVDGQLIRVIQLVRSFSLQGYTRARHGGCIGADEEFDAICREADFHLTIHWSTLHHKQMKRPSKQKEEVWINELPPLVRNRRMVEAAKLLIAAPSSYREELRSGTWSTIRYARKAELPTYIVFPDGSMKKENVE